MEKPTYAIKKNIDLKKIFYFLAIAFLLVFFIANLLTNNYALKLYTTRFTTDSFMDFFNMLRSNYGNARLTRYTGTDTIYPPLANLIYFFMGTFLEVSAFENTSVSIKLSQSPMVIFIFYCLITTIAYFIIMQTTKRGSIKEKTLFTTITLFTIPFIYQYERANIIFLALIFLLLFFLWIDSENKIFREIALISLAIAAGIKIYPAIFGLLLLKEKRFKESFRLIIYGLLFTFAPFLFFDGIHVIPKFIENLFFASNQFSMSRQGLKLSYTSTISTIFEHFDNAPIILSKIFVVVSVLGGILSSFFLKEKWKTVLLLTCLMVGIPSISYAYTPMFMVIPLMMLLDHPDKHKKTEFLYLGLLILILFPIPFFWTEGQNIPMYSSLYSSTPVIIEGTAIIITTILLIFEGAINLLRKLKTKKNKILTASSLILVLLLISVFNTVKYIGNPIPTTTSIRFCMNDTVIITPTAPVEQIFTAKKSQLDSLYVKFGDIWANDLNLAITDINTGEIIHQQNLLAQDLKIKSINKIELNNVPVISGNAYQIRIAIVDVDPNTSFSIFRTQFTFATPETYATVHYEPQDYSFGIDVYESALQ